jgi:hypothetical protein
MKTLLKIILSPGLAIPELSALSNEQRKIAFGRAYWRSFRHWKAWSGIVVALLIVGMVAYVADAVGAGPVLQNVALGASVIVAMIILDVFRREPMRREVADWIASHNNSDGAENPNRASEPQR